MTEPVKQAEKAKGLSILGENIKRFGVKDYKDGFYDGIRIGIVLGFIAAFFILK